jgi:hypothetical protein
MSRLVTLLEAITTELKKITLANGYSADVRVLNWAEARNFLLENLTTPLLFVKSESLTWVEGTYPFLTLEITVNIQCNMPINTDLPIFNAGFSPSTALHAITLDVIQATRTLQTGLGETNIADYVVSMTIGDIQYTDPNDGSNVILFTLPLIIRFIETME